MLAQNTESFDHQAFFPDVHSELAIQTPLTGGSYSLDSCRWAVALNIRNYSTEADTGYPINYVRT